MSEFLESLNIKELNEYQINKRNWLMESHYPAERTVISYWNSLESNKINMLERVKGKDLYEFSTTEIKEAINYAPTIKLSSKRVLRSVITKYNQWAIEREYNTTGENPCDSIDHKDIIVNMSALEMTYVDLDYFYEVLKVVQGSDVDKMILVMARYGIKTKDMPYLRWEDVDRERKTIRISHQYEVPLFLPIDNRFIECVDKAKDEDGYTREIEYKFARKDRLRKYEDYGYIIKVTENTDGEGIIKENTLRNRVHELSKLKTLDDKNFKRPNVRNYNDSRKYDILFDIMDIKGSINTKDIRKVIGIFEEKITGNKAYLLKTNFELISGEDVVTERRRKGI